MPRFWGDTDEAYHRRANRLLKKTMGECNLRVFGESVLLRLYDYIGHAVRTFSRNPCHLAGCVLRWRDAEWKQTLSDTIGHQGHHGRVAPWNYERQFHVYFWRRGLHWKHVALQKDDWLAHREQWVREYSRRVF